MAFLITDSREKKALGKAYIRFLPILAVVIILSSVLVSYDSFQNRNHNLMHQQFDEIVDAMIAYRDQISLLTSIIRTAEADYIEWATSQVQTEPAQAILSDYIYQYPVIDQLRILDCEGMEIFRVKQESGVAITIPDSDLQDRSYCACYLETALLGKHQFLFSGIVLATENHEIALDPDTGKAKPTLRISSPLEFSGQRFGYLIVDFQMRDYLDALRTFVGLEGCTIRMMDEDGILYNDAIDANNFGTYDGEDFRQHGKTIYAFFPNIDLSADSGSFQQGDVYCSYTAFSNVYDRSKDYFLSKTAPQKLILLLCYNKQSPYAADLRYSYFYHLIASWKTQLLGVAGFLLLYLLVIRLIFFYDRSRFTDLFTGNRYSKSTLRQAIRHKQFLIYYQPVINIQNGTVMGFEALSRWNHHGEILPPSMFMDEILRYHLGQKLDENVFLTVREDRKRMEQYPGFKDTFISVNCCQQTFNSLIKDPPTTIIQLTEAEKKYIVLELLENIIFNQQTQEKIQEMYQHNVLFAIDDFGTGYSNVSFIRRFENLKVKIDRTFVPVDTTDRKERVIIEAFVKMFIDQGMKLIAEGVETREQLLYLINLGVAGVQGFYFSQPMTIDRLFEFIENREFEDKF